MASTVNRQRLLVAAPGAEIAAQGRYNLLQSPRLYADAMLNWPGRQKCPPLNKVAVGMLDGPVNVAQVADGSRQVKQKSFLISGRAAAAEAKNHGTAVAALLVGGTQTDQLGLARGAILYAAIVFSRRKAGASTETVLTGLNWLLVKKVKLINLSFAGPNNRVLDRGTTIAAKKGHILIAAAGPRGLVSPSPAAAPSVIAISAVDSANILEVGAASGAFIEFVAPGVDIWLPKSDGRYAYDSGSSFAAPVVTGIAARLLAKHPNLSLSITRALLKSNSVDLGAPGRDKNFGFGLVQAQFSC